MKKNCILIIGAKGQLGRELVGQGEKLKGGIIGIDVDELDITDQIAVQAYFKTDIFCGHQRRCLYGCGPGGKGIRDYIFCEQGWTM